MRSPPLVRWLLGLLAVLLLAALGVAAWLNFGGLRDQIEKQASNALGRQVTLAGPLTWSPAGSHLGLGLRGVRIANPPGFSSSVMADIDHLTLYLPLDALWRGEVRIDEATVDGARVHLEITPAGDDNWTFADTADDDPEGPDLSAMPAVLTLEQTDIDYRDGQSGGHHRIGIQRLHLAAGPASLSAQGEGTVDGTPVALDLETTGLKALLAGHGPWPLRGKVQVAESRARIDLEIGPGTPRWKVSGAVRIADVDVPGALRTDIQVKVQAARMETHGSAPPAAESATPSVGALRTTLQLLDLDLAIDAERARIAGYEVHGLKLHSRIEDGDLNLEARLPLEAGTADIRFDLAPAEDGLRGRLRAEGKGMGIKVRYRGEDMDVEIKDLALGLQASGSSFDRMVAGLNGSMTAKGLTVGRTEDGAGGPRLRIDRMQADTDSKRTRLLINGAYNAVAYKIDLGSAGLPALRNGRDSLPLHAKLEAAGARLTLDGTLRHGLSQPHLMAKAKLEGKNMSALGKLLRVSLPKLAQYRIAGKLDLTRADSGKIDARLDDLRAELGKTRLQGELRLSATTPAEAPGPATAPPTKLAVEGRLHASTLDLEEWSGYTGGPRTEPATSKPDLALPENLHLDLMLEAEHLAGEPLALSDLSTRLTLRDRLLTLDPFRVHLDNTPLDGTLQLDGRKQTPNLHFSLDTEELLSGQGGIPSTEGALRFRAGAVHISGESKGRNGAQWKDNLQLKGRVEHLQLSIRTGPAKPPLSLRITNLEFDRSKTSPIRLTANGIFDQVPFTLSAASRPVRAAGAGGIEHQAVDINLQAKDLSIGLKTPAAWPLDPQRLDLPFTLQAEKLPAAWRPEAFAKGPYLVSGRLLRDPEGFHLEDLRARAGDSDLEGRLSLQTHKDRNKLVANVASDLLDLSALTTAEGAPASSAKTDDLILPDAPIIPPLPRNWDADIRYHAKRIQFSRFQVMDTEIEAKWRAARLTISPLALTTASGGRARAEVTMDLVQDPPAISLKTHIEHLDLGWIWVQDQRGQKTKWLTNIDADLRGRGKTLHAFLSGANGSLGFDAGSLTVDLRMLRLWTTRLFSLMVKGFEKQQDTEGQILCIIADASIDNGVVRSDGFLFDVDDASIFGSGELRLSDEKLDLRLVPKLKSRSVFNTAIPVDVRGTLSRPRFLPSPEGAILAAGKTYLSVINPLFLLGNYALSGNRDKSPCDTFREELRAREQGGRPDAKSKQRKPGGFIQNITESINDLVP